MKKLICFLIALFVFTSSTIYAIGPIPITLWAGAAGGSLGVGANAGMDIGLALPFLPAFIVEAESSGTILPVGIVNIAASISRVGIVGKINLIGDILKLRLSAGSANISSNTTFAWGSGNVAKTNSTSYISVGPEFSLFGLGCMLRAIFMPLPEGTVGELDLNLSLNF